MCILLYSQMKFTPAGGRVQINIICEMQNHDNRNKIISKVCTVLRNFFFSLLRFHSVRMFVCLCSISSVWMQWVCFVWRLWTQVWVSLLRIKRESSENSLSSTRTSSKEEVSVYACMYVDLLAF